MFIRAGHSLLKQVLVQLFIYRTQIGYKFCQLSSSSFYVASQRTQRYRSSTPEYAPLETIPV